MKLLIPALVAALGLTACSRDDAAGASTVPPNAVPAAAPANAPANAAVQTEAVYGDEAPVAIDAKPAADAHAAGEAHAHAADGSHPGETKADKAPAEDHPHEEGATAHEH